ncbi:ABC transporter ATP-binding protein [Paenibacillus sp. JX-17]|uniref:ABC transporter ATP-binding protein n=1 Tax=Paenibacillus lacisoli TaxID=3064525 RepID=A0ABT9CEU8_9BACL|nr:ABC transporter ATP-binding protein [Paenibacillus sp. JX-17]MDO7907800.1 ABC transporter ATP-binding protein [Paenibacillus sp. JX-17]
MKTVIQTAGLGKIYANGRGCRDITLTVGQGEAFGFLGPNGAGKSTFVKMLVGLTAPTEGSGEVMGHPLGSVESRRQIGYLPELYRYQEWLSGEEVLRLHAGLLGMSRSEASSRINMLLDEVGIGKRGRDRVKHYSKGMQQRLGLACALLGDPQILFLDEPSSAMDPVGRSEVRELLHKLKQQGKTIFLNSHLLEDVESVCDRLALMMNGSMLYQGPLTDILQRTIRWRFRVGGFSPVLLDWLRERSGLNIYLAPAGAGSSGSGPDTEGMEDTVWLEAELDSEHEAGWLNALMVGQGMTLYEVNRLSDKLEDWFMEAVSGRNHRGER